MTVVVARAPGRVNIIGEHTDYNDGYVLPMAIHLGVTCTASDRHDLRMVIRSTQVPNEIVDLDVRTLAPADCGGWSAYVAGAVWSLMRATGRCHGLDITIDGDVPLGAGLSSSAAVECAVVTAVAQLWRIPFQAREFARWAQAAENDFVGVPTGSMDQVASMLGREGSAVFYDVQADSIDWVPLDVASAGLSFVVIDTRAAHALVDGGYASRRASCERAAELLHVRSLRDIVDLPAALALVGGEHDGDVLVRRTRHVVTENARVLAARTALEARDFSALGALMDASHASLREDYEVSCAELDLAVDAARSVGAVGARMTGGGFGGSALALIPTGLGPAVEAAAADAFASAGFRSPRVWPVRPGAGARVM
jgi:galactokinase